MNYDKLFINGQWITSSSKDWIEVENPADKTIITRVPAANYNDVDQAIKSAENAFYLWKDLQPSQRQDKVRKMINYLLENFEEIAPVLAKELGCTTSFALSRHLENYKEAMEGFLEAHEKIEYVQERQGYRLYRRPRGIVACITPWNYPFGQIVKKVIPALLAGNSVILKPSKSTPMTAYFWAKAAEVAHLPPGVFNLVPGRGGQVGNILAQDPRVNAISFTGSTKGGKEVASLALNSSTKRITLEMGGKSAAVILEGSDHKRDLKLVLDTVYYNVGQTCSAKTRLIVPKKEVKEIEEILIQLSNSYKFGNPMDGEDIDVGVLNSKKQWEKVRSYIKLGLEEGAQLLYGKLPEKEAKGYEVSPIIFTNVTPNMRIAQEEIFGPVLCLISYDTIEEAIKIANNSIYGLAGMVFGGKEEEALYVASQIHTGQVQVNGSPQIQNAPFGGFKESGIGREGSIEGLEEFFEYQTIFI